MPDWTDLKLWMAVCWKVSWNVDPLALSVPLRLLDPEPPPLVVLDELQAVSDKAIAARAAPAITTPWLRTRCIVKNPFSTTGRVLRVRMALMSCGRFGLAEDHASGRPEGLTDHPEAGGQARVPRHFPAGLGTWIMAREQPVQGLDLGNCHLGAVSAQHPRSSPPQVCRCSHASPPYRQRIHL